MNSTATPPAPGTAPIRVFIVDDHELVREGLRAVLNAQPDMVVTGDAATCADAIRRLPLAEPDIAIVDLQLPDGSGADLCRHIARQFPSTRSVMLSSFAHESAVLEAVRAGAAGYVVKNVDSSTFVDCARRVAAGEQLVDTRVKAALQRKANSPETDELLARLTDREREVLRHVAEGLTNRRIGELMGISDKTVKNYVSILMEKLGVTRRAGAAAYYEQTIVRRDWAADPEDTNRSPLRF